jgi:hypothetical protein
MKKVIKKAQFGFLAKSAAKTGAKGAAKSTLLAKYMGGAAENTLQKKLHSIGTKRASQDAAIVSGSKKINPRTPAAERDAIYAERNAQRKAAGLPQKRNELPIEPAQKRPFSERFSDARQSFYNTAGSKSTQISKGAKQSKKGIIDKQQGYQKNGGKTMIKRADGSVSQRGLWDNIRAAKGSGKKPTAAMLKQEKKIKAKTKK